MSQKSEVDFSKPKAIVIPTSWRESFQRLPDRDVATLIRAAFAFADGEPLPPMKVGAATMWPLLRDMIVKNQQKYDDVCQKRRDAINKRWEKEKAGTKEETPIQPDTNVNGSTDLNYYKNVNVNVNKKVSKDTIPPNPPAGELGNEKSVKERIRRCIGRYYHRRKSTAWSKREEIKLTEIAVRSDALAECLALLKLYRSTGYVYQRRDVLTLLNNWAGEVDRARNIHKPVNGGKDRTYAGISGQF